MVELIEHRDAGAAELLSEDVGQRLWLDLEVDPAVHGPMTARLESGRSASVFSFTATSFPDRGVHPTSHTSVDRFRLVGRKLDSRA